MSDTTLSLRERAIATRDSEERTQREEQENNDRLRREREAGYLLSGLKWAGEIQPSPVWFAENGSVRCEVDGLIFQWNSGRHGSSGVQLVVSCPAGHERFETVWSLATLGFILQEPSDADSCCYCLDEALKAKNNAGKSAPPPALEEQLLANLRELIDERIAEVGGAA